MEDTGTTKICPSCRKPLPPGAPMGLCPGCLVKSGFNTGTDPSNPGKEPGFVPPPAEELKRLFPHLEIIELIGKGGMGAVYKARQPALDRLVALKVLPPGAADDAGFAERFNREARALARLSHPHIVAVYDFGQTAGQPYLVMEYVDGPNLRQVQQAGRLTPQQALAIVPQICEALQFAHNEGIVHRDIKPENVLLDKKGRVKITDFGIAKIVGALSEKTSLTGAKDVLGTPHYMAPEQVEQPQTVDHRADIYSLGVVFYELLTGELPLGKFQPPSKKVHVDVRLDEVVLHALEKEPERRYQHASQVKTDVETIAGSPGARSSSGTLTAAPTDKPAPTPNPWEAGLIALGITVFTIVFTVGLPSLPEHIRWPLTFICLFGVAACLLTLAGWWPAPNFGIPDSGFARRNLHHQRELGLAAFLCACLSGLIPTVFFWLAPWLVPWLTPRGQEFMLWLTALTAMLAILMGLAGRKTRLGHTAFIVGGINLTIWVLFFVAGILSEQPMEASVRSQKAASENEHAPASAIPNSYLRAALAGMDTAVARIEAAADSSRLMDQADVFNHLNELCDQLQGKNQSPPPSPQDWGIHDGDSFAQVTDLLHSLEETAEGMRDVASSSRGPKDKREALLKELLVSLNRDYGALKSLLTAASMPSPEEQVELSWKRVQGWKLQRPPSALVRNVSEDGSSATDDVLRVKLRHAEEALAEAKAQAEVGRLPQSEVQAARDAVRTLKAEVTGDAVTVARVRLEAAKQQLAFAKERFEAGQIPGSEYRKAQNAVELCQAELTSAVAKSGRTAADKEAPEFGPIIDRQLLTHLFASENRVLDFESGEVFTVPHGSGFYVATNDLYVQNHPRAFFDWIVKVRADLFATEGLGVTLHLDDGRLVRLTNVAGLDEVSRADLVSAERSGIAQDASLNKTNDVGAVFAFRTREGTLGAFQITRIIDKPPSLALSYKLASNSGKP